MIIRKAEKQDLDDIMQVYKSCVDGMIALGIDQWDETYPNRDIIEQDLEIGDYYVGLIDNEIVAGIKIDAQRPKYGTKV